MCTWLTVSIDELTGLFCNIHCLFLFILHSCFSHLVFLSDLGIFLFKGIIFYLSLIRSHVFLFSTKLLQLLLVGLYLSPILKMFAHLFL